MAQNERFPLLDNTEFRDKFSFAFPNTAQQSAVSFYIFEPVDDIAVFSRGKYFTARLSIFPK